MRYCLWGMWTCLLILEACYFERRWLLFVSNTSTRFYLRSHGDQCFQLLTLSKIVFAGTYGILKKKSIYLFLDDPFKNTDLICVSYCVNLRVALHSYSVRDGGVVYLIHKMMRKIEFLIFSETGGKEKEEKLSWEKCWKYWWLVACLLGFYGISIFVGYLTPNLFLCK